jgi:hypothetical protein
VIIAGVAIGQPGKDKMPAGMPKMTPEQEKCMQAMMEAATPGAMHDWLVKGCGTWEGTFKMWESPDAQPQESTCKSVVSPMLEGRFTKCETTSSMMGMPFQGQGIVGYNNTTQQFEQNWIDNMGTMQMNMTGKLSDDKKTLTWTSHFMCPVQKKEVAMREVQTMTGADSLKLEFYGPDMSGKVQEYKMMEITMTRKAGSAPKMDTKPMTAPKSGH